MNFDFERLRAYLIAKREFYGADTMEIVAANGLPIVFDRADYPLLSKYAWCANRKRDGKFYATAHVPGSGDWPNKKRVKMHQVLMNAPPGYLVHHKNNNGLDNRRCNLEVTTNRVNILHAKDGFGVTFHKQKKKWRARGTDENGKRISLGLHATKEIAADAVKKWRAQKAIELEAKGTLEALHIAQIFRNAA
jgi:hypothetical protein